MRAFTLSGALAGALLAAACGGSTASDKEPPPIVYEGTPGVLPAELGANVLRVRASVNGSPARTIVVDTGAAVTALDATAFSDGTPLAPSIPRLTLGGVTFLNVPAVTVNLCGASCTAETIDGLLGANLLRQFVVSFDYQTPAIVFGAPTVPPIAEAADVEVPFTLEGGGHGKIDGSSTELDVPATRIAVTANIDGVDHPMIVDTGASYVLLRPAVFDAMVSDGRRTLPVANETVDGTVTGQVARARLVRVGDAAVDATPAQTVSDAFVDGLAGEVGHPVDGLIGGAFLRMFFVTVDYPSRRLALHRFTQEDRRGDEYRRVGILLRDAGSGYGVGKLLPGTDAAKNAPIDLSGAPIVSIDGANLDGLDVESADRLLRGDVGDRRTIVYARPGGSVGTATFAVEDVLPLP